MNGNTHPVKSSSSTSPAPEPYVTGWHRHDYLAAVLLLSYAAFIWLRNTGWQGKSDEVLPILAALPLFVWLGMPWRLRTDGFQIDYRWLVFGIVGLVAGVLSDLTLLLALSWTCVLWSWLKGRLAPESIPASRRLLILPVMAFPWLALDGQTLSWWFRLSAAYVAENAFLMTGLAVIRNGTSLTIQNQPLEVSAACDGLKVLQSMLIAGTFLAVVRLGKNRWYWWSLPVLVALAWVANTARVITLGVVALSFGANFAMGWFHTWGGWFVLMLMFCLCWVCFGVIERCSARKVSKRGDL